MALQTFSSLLPSKNCQWRYDLVYNRPPWAKKLPQSVLLLAVPRFQVAGMICVLGMGSGNGM